MPVLILWAVPAIVVIGGVGYYLVRAVHKPDLLPKEKARAGIRHGLSAFCGGNKWQSLPLNLG
jgi:hypothetical protein